MASFYCCDWIHIVLLHHISASIPMIYVIMERSKKRSKFRVTGLCEGNPLVTGEFPSQRASNAENVPIWWRHHDECRDTRDAVTIDRSGHGGAAVLQNQVTKKPHLHDPTKINTREGPPSFCLITSAILKIMTSLKNKFKICTSCKDLKKYMYGIAITALAESLEHGLAPQQL